MNKVVYNACHGGFGLSRAAVLRGREISGNPKWGGVCLAGDVYASGEVCKEDYGHCSELARHDSVLVQVVEELGDKASSRFANLQIMHLPKGTPYRIDEYDGYESVETPNSYAWITID